MEFKSLNGYTVKDETARKMVSDLETAVNKTIEDNQTAAERTIAEMTQNISDNGEAIEENARNIANVSTLISSQNRITPQMFGAKGDGVTNDNVAFTLAIQHCTTVDGVLFVPSGTYIVSSPIIVPGDFSLIGESRNDTVIKLAAGANCNVIESENFRNLMDGTSADMPNNVHIESMTIDGSRESNSAGHGIAIFASEPFLSDLIVKECAECGIYSNANVAYISRTEGIEGTFKDIYVKFTGKHCIEFRGPNDSYFENVKCVNGSQLADNVYDNFYAEAITFRMNHFHGWNFHDDIGYRRTRYCIALVNCENVECTTSHFEGGRTGCVLLESTIGAKFSNSTIYASFGLWNIAVKGNYNMFEGCTYVGKAPDSVVNFYACVVYLQDGGNVHNRFEGICTADANFVDENNGGGNYYNITSYSNKPFALNPAYDKSIFILHNNQIETAANRKMSFPYAVNAPVNICRQVNDLELTEQYWIANGVDILTVKSATGTASLQLPPTVNGSHIYIGNGSDASLNVECAGHTINGKTSYTLEPNTMKHFVGDASGNYWC